VLVPPDSIQAGRLLSSYSRFLGQEEGDYEGSQDAFNRAIAIAEREGDIGLQMRTLVDAADADIYATNWERAREKGAQALELIDRVDDPRSESAAHFAVGIGHLIRGEPDLADGPAAGSVAAAERLRHHFYIARSSFL